MNISLSPNTQAVLLLTAPLIAGRADASSELLTAGEYQRLVRLLTQMNRQPADLLSLMTSQAQAMSTLAIRGVIKTSKT